MAEKYFSKEWMAIYGSATVAILVALIGSAGAGYATLEYLTANGVPIPPALNRLNPHSSECVTVDPQVNQTINNILNRTTPTSGTICYP